MFDWLLALSGLSTIFTWLSINIAHIRFRQAWKAQGHSVDELPFRALGGIWGSVFAATVLILVLYVHKPFKCTRLLMRGEKHRAVLHCWYFKELLTSHKS